MGFSETLLEFPATDQTLKGLARPLQFSISKSALFLFLIPRLRLRTFYTKRSNIIVSSESSFNSVIIILILQFC